MIGLLVNPPQPGYPADYLLARLAVRRRRWEEELAPRGEAAGSWAALAQEFRWLYGQLNAQLRQELAPLFVYFELRPLFLFLRGLAGTKGGEGTRVLMATLLADGLKRDLLREHEAGAALRLLSRVWPTKIDLGRLAATGGLAAVEQEMTRQVLAIAASRPAVLQRFWAAVADRENVMALAKRLHWQAERPFAYHAGGAIDRRRLRKSEQHRALSRTLSLSGVFDRAVRDGEWPLEEALIDRVQQQLVGQQRPLAPATAVASYMWGAYATTRRLAVAPAGGVRP